MSHTPTNKRFINNASVWGEAYMGSEDRNWGCFGNEGGNPASIDPPPTKCDLGRQQRALPKTQMPLSKKHLSWEALQRNTPLLLGMALRIWSVGAGLLTLHFIIANLTPRVQGYYFTFQSLAQLTQLVDLGLQTLLIQFASHEAADLRLDRQHGLTGPRDATSRLASLGRFALTWYGGGSIILIPGLLAAGWWVFSDAGTNVDWRGPWLTLCVVVAADFCLNSFFWILEGMNDLKFVYGYKLIRGILTSALLWILLSLNVGLWAIPISLGAVVLLSTISLLIVRRKFLFTILSRPLGKTISWRHEIIPLQWRLALSAVASFAIYSMFVPVTFKFVGPVEAGQFGVTWTLVDNMTLLALQPITVKFPSMGTMAAKKDWAGLDHLTLNKGLLSLVLTILGATTIILGAWGLQNFVPSLSIRLLPLLPLSIMCVAATSKTVMAVLIYYLRAHREEPIAALTAVIAPLMAIGLIGGAKLGGVTGVALTYFSIYALIMLPATVWISYRKRRAWHSGRAAAADSALEKMLPVADHSIVHE